MDTKTETHMTIVNKLRDYLKKPFLSMKRYGNAQVVDKMMKTLLSAAKEDVHKPNKFADPQRKINDAIFSEIMTYGYVGVSSRKDELKEDIDAYHTDVGMIHDAKSRHLDPAKDATTSSIDLSKDLKVISSVKESKARWFHDDYDHVNPLTADMTIDMIHCIYKDILDSIDQISKQEYLDRLEDLKTQLEEHHDPTMSGKVLTFLTDSQDEVLCPAVDGKLPDLGLTLYDRGINSKYESERQVEDLRSDESSDDDKKADTQVLRSVKSSPYEWFYEDQPDAPVDAEIAESFLSEVIDDVKDA